MGKPDGKSASHPATLPRPHNQKEITMAGTCVQAASVARGCTADSQEYRKLSGLMCWDAVAHCALLAGVISEANYRNLLGNENSLIGQNARAVATAGAMALIPGGHILGFFAGHKLIHAMITTGNGRAAGNKNNCVGVGHSVGWEELNLVSGLQWAQGGGITAPGLLGPSRSVTIRHRPVTDL